VPSYLPRCYKCLKDSRMTVSFKPLCMAVDAFLSLKLSLWIFIRLAPWLTALKKIKCSPPLLYIRVLSKYPK